MNVLVTYASKHGATAEIASAIAETLGAAGLLVDVRPCSDVRDVSSYEAVVIGSAIYFGHWLAPAHGLVAEVGAQLRLRPVWAFSSGRVGGVPPVDIDPAHVAWIVEHSGAREHTSFEGRLAVGAELSWRERTATRAVHASSGDYRDWAAIDRWAAGIAQWLLLRRDNRGDISGPSALPGPEAVVRQ